MNTEDSEKLAEFLVDLTSKRQIAISTIVRVFILSAEGPNDTAFTKTLAENDLRDSLSVLGVKKEEIDKAITEYWR